MPKKRVLGSWYFIFVFARCSSLSNTSFFLIFEVFHNTDDNFDTADNNDGNDAKKGPLTIKRTPSKGWKTTETTRPPMKNQQPRTQFVFFFRSFQRWLTDLCLFEGGFVVLCHGCDECWSCYFYSKWRVSETRPKLALGLPVEGIISYCVCVGWHGFTKEQHTKTNIWIFGSLMFLSFYICSTTEQYS